MYKNNKNAKLKEQNKGSNEDLKWGKVRVIRCNSINRPKKVLVVLQMQFIWMKSKMNFAKEVFKFVIEQN